MELAVRVSVVDNVGAFRRAMVPLPGLWSDRLTSEGNFVSLYHLAGMHQVQGASVLVDDDAVGLSLRC